RKWQRWNGRMSGCFEHERTRVIIDSSEASMKPRFLTLVVLICGALGSVVLAQDQPRAAQGAVSPDQRAQAYYNVTMGHLYEQQQTITAAIGQLREILRLDSTDGESTLWLARLLRLDNQDDQAEQVLRGVLVRDPQNKGAVEQLSQLFLDHSNPQQAISLLESFVQRAPNAELYDRLGDAYQQIQQRGKSEQAYRQAVALEPDQAEHRRHL